ncbi:MAG: AAA family ATPase [Xanthomonadales bacterium]|jgi:exonuclease SbcC|nr:AAA family ATPase [Xanthomonadales bacterium]
MRILAIRGRNLASLAGDFAIDFQSEPLASAGLYAISGPTGSGKSTLLDALCLALYDNTPRLSRAEKRGPRLPEGDGSGDAGLFPGDTRTLLRRGSTEGWAEADFVAIDGIRWRARWAVRRARGREQGNLQAVERALNRLDDGHPWPGHKHELQAQISRLTGLDFTQFCRSVLLAQGEFAALLKAPASERGQLLEALTGTAIFQQLSKAAHERKNQARAEEEALTLALGQHAPLDTKARSVLEAELADTHTAAELAHGELVALEAESHWHAEGARITAALTALAAEQRAVESRLAALDAPALAAAGQARRLAAPLSALDAAAARLLAVAAGRQSAAEALSQGETVLATAAARLHTAETDLQAQQEGRRAAEPALIAARAADAELARLAREQAALTAPRAEVEAALAALQGEQALIAAELDRLQLAPQRYADWLGAHPDWADPALDWRAREATLSDLLQLTQRQTTLQQELATLATTLAAAEAQHAEAEAAVTAAASAVEAAIEERQQAADAAAACDSAEQLETEARALEARQQQLQQLAQAWADTRGREQEATAARHAMQTAEAGARATEAEAVAASEVETRAEADVAALQRSLERLRLRADAHTAALRLDLVAGEPCPVCGATEHPGAAPDPAASVLTGLAAELEVAVQSHREARQLREQRALAAARAVQVAEQARSTAERARLAALAARDTLRLKISEWAPGVQQLPLGPEDLAPFRAALIAEGEALGRRREARAVQLRAVEQARGREDAARLRLSTAQRERDRGMAALTGPRAALARGGGELDGLQSRIMALTQTLPAALADAAGRDAALRRHREGAALKAQADADLALRAERLRQGERLSLQFAHQRQRQTEFATRAAEVDGQLAAARETRRRVLAATDTEAHAAALDAAVRMAEQAATAARLAHASALAARDRQAASLAGLDAEAAAAGAAVDEREQVLHRALAEWQPALPAPQALIELRAQLAALPHTLDADLAAWNELGERSRVLCAQTEALQQEQARWAAQAASAQGADAVAAARHDLAARLGELQARRGALRHQLDTDRERGARHHQQLVELDAIRRANQRWHQLADLIGSHDGSKFRLYAQQFTLEVLVEHANAHLAELAPRYRLTAVIDSLGLQMIDTDFGDERRSVHSLSGGESFLVSLALALGLASMAAERIRVESLFIDEGFGSLDADTLAVALNALDRLQAQGRRIGVISHVPDMAERIGVQIRIRPRGAGRSSVEVMG